MAVSWSQWWCQPETMPGSVLTVPAQIASVVKASSRVIPGVGWPGLRSPARTSRTRSVMAASLAAEGCLLVLHGHDVLAVVAKGEAVAGGLRGRLLAEPLLQVPMHPFVQVQEAQDLPWPPERDAVGQPDESHAFAAEPPSRVGDDLPEWEEGLRELEGDPADVELGPGGEVGPGSVPKPLDHDLIAGRSGQAVEHLPDLGPAEIG